MLLRRIARPLLAGVFIYRGIETLRDPEAHAKTAGPVLDRMAEVVPVRELPPHVTLVKVDAGVKIGAGMLLAIGRAPRLAATVLSAGVIPSMLSDHRFWEMRDAQQRTEHQLHFLKDLGMLGGLMLAASDTEGKPSLAWRARHAGRTSAATAELFHRDVTDGFGELSRRAGTLGGRLAEVAGRTGGQLAEVAERTGGHAADAAVRAGHRAEEVAARYGPVATELAGRYADRAAEVAGHGGALMVERSRQLGHTLGASLADTDLVSARAAKRMDKTTKRARKGGRKARKRALRRVDRARAKITRR
jgi:uncharacterized membrane protein YphA (DoxX/SURF4 family)